MKTYARLFASLGMSTVAMCFAVVTAIAQSPASPVKAPPDHAARTQAPGDGIKVHGYWTIDVRNADGSLASHNEFMNALQPSGATALSALLGRSNTVGSWQLDLMGAGSGGPCITTEPSGPTPAPCTAVEPGTTIPGDFATAWFPTLALNLVQGPAGTSGLELTGSVTASSAESIEQVRSVIVLSPSGSRTPFSARTLATPIQVATGQQIYVKVVLSFS